VVSSSSDKQNNNLPLVKPRWGAQAGALTTYPRCDEPGPRGGAGMNWDGMGWDGMGGGRGFEKRNGKKERKKVRVEGMLGGRRESE